MFTLKDTNVPHLYLNAPLVDCISLNFQGA